MRYFETYYYANIVHNVLSEPFGYLRVLNEWHEDNQVELFSNPFPRWSVLHDFCHFIIRALLSEHVDDVAADAFSQNESARLWVDDALRYHGFEVAGFREWLRAEGVSIADVTEDHIADYHSDLFLTGPAEELLIQLTEEVFFVLFGNRLLLGRLHGYVAGIVELLSGEGAEPDVSRRFASEGRLVRQHIPQWARNAVFFRDRGQCTHCLTDLSGLVSAQNDDNYDHIIPLKMGGINDVTNLQLLCGTCNKGKGTMTVAPSSRYEAWY